MVLRLAAKRLEDGSFDYAMGFDQPEQHDSRVTSNGIDVVVAPTSTEFLRDAKLDYVEMEDGQFHFIFINPNDPSHIPPEKEPGEKKSRRRGIQVTRSG